MGFPSHLSPHPQPSSPLATDLITRGGGGVDTKKSTSDQTLQQAENGVKRFKGVEQIWAPEEKVARVRGVCVDSAKPFLYTRLHGPLTVRTRFPVPSGMAMVFWAYWQAAGKGRREGALVPHPLAPPSPCAPLPARTSQRGWHVGAWERARFPKASRGCQLPAASGKRSHGGHMHTT